MSENTVEQKMETPRKFSFGVALEMLRRGFFVHRTGWNGKGMYIILDKCEDKEYAVEGNSAKYLHVPEGTVIKVQPHLVMFTADGSFVPWLASQTDLLAQDWEILGDE